MSDPTLYQGCLAATNNTNDTYSILQCIADAHEADQKSIAAGLDSFFLIYGGAMVLYVSVRFHYPSVCYPEGCQLTDTC
jgi:hypothetical protein